MKKLRIALRLIINIPLAVIFFLFASLQFNDPDPFIWILAYGLTATFCLIYCRQSMAINVRWAYLGAALVMVIGSLIQFPPQWDGFGTSMKTENQELARESIGLLLCGMVLFIQFATLKSKAMN